jgi:hypothetical protein
MNVNKAIACGLAGNELSKQITGTSDVSASRTAIATSSGAVLGIMVSGAAIGVGMVASPITVPLALSSGLVAGIASLCD